MLLKFPTIIPIFFAFKGTISLHFAGYASVALETIWLHEPRDLIFSGPLMTELSNTGTLHEPFPVCGSARKGSEKKNYGRLCLQMTWIYM